MAISRLGTLFSLCAVATANTWGGGGCPYLSKVVPEGQMYADMASELLHLRTTDCTAFAQRFSEHANFTFVSGRTATSPAEVENECRERSAAAAATTLENVFPAFSTSGMMFEALYKHGDKEIWGLGNINFCSKSKQVTSGYALMNEFPAAPTSLRRIGERLLQQVFEKHDCNVYSELLDDDVLVEHNGEPLLVTRDRQTTFRSASSAQTTCEQKAAREKRIHTYAKVNMQRFYYDAAGKKLTIVAERDVETIFQAGVRSQPIAITLQFTPTNKVKAVHFYETEIMHILNKWGSKYGAKHLSKPHQEAVAFGKGNVASEPLLENVIHRTSPQDETVMQKAPAEARFADLFLSSVSAAADNFRACWLPLAMLSVGVAYLF